MWSSEFGATCEMILRSENGLLIKYNLLVYTIAMTDVLACLPLGQETRRQTLNHLAALPHGVFVSNAKAAVIPTWHHAPYAR